MSMTEWVLRGPEIATCNCNYGCPCQFNSLPTTGDCKATIAMQIIEGHYGNVKLDGLKWAGIFSWPGPIHLGHGEAQLVIDERATPEQRDALLKILTGQDSEPGATAFQVFSSTLEKVHDPLFKDIDFNIDMESCDGSVSIQDTLKIVTTAIRNPITGKPHHPKVALRSGFEFAEAEFASGSSKSQGAIILNNDDKHAHLAMIHMTGKGVVH